MNTPTMRLLPIIMAVLIVACSGPLSAYERNLAGLTQPLRGLVIMLDPGHGGADPGAVGPTGLKESATNLRVARYLRGLLQADGAEVLMTRDSDVFLSLSQRVAMAQESKPDLFVSIHHNASLRPISTNRAEIYYAAQESDTAAVVAKAMSAGLADEQYGDEATAIPGGFYVLQKNHVPAVLTEGSYISIPHIEKALRCGKSLTDQAQIYRMAIRRVFRTGPLRVELLVPEMPLVLSTPYLNLICTANRPLAFIHVKGHHTPELDLHFERMPIVGNSYILLNRQPLPSGEHDFVLTFQDTDGMHSTAHVMPIHVHLPVEHSVLLPVAPFIPSGFAGDFPLQLLIKDSYHRVNHRSVEYLVRFAGKTLAGHTRNDGSDVLHLPLTGKERDAVAVQVLIDDEIIAETTIPVRNVAERFILGRIVCTHNGEGLERVKIAYGAHRVTFTSQDGYFFCQLPLIFQNLKLSLTPPLGYPSQETWVRTKGQLINTPHICLTPRAPQLLGRTIGLIAARSEDDWVRPLVRSLMKLGAHIVRLNYPEHTSSPAWEAARQANAMPNISLILSLKTAAVPDVSLRHYHRGGTGKKFLEQVARALKVEFPAQSAEVRAGSEYELGHTGAPAAVIVKPASWTAASTLALTQAITDTLSQWAF